MSNIYNGPDDDVGSAFVPIFIDNAYRPIKMNREPNLSSRYTVELLEYGEYYGVQTEYLRENTGKKKGGFVTNGFDKILKRYEVGFFFHGKFTRILEVYGRQVIRMLSYYQHNYQLLVGVLQTN